MLQSQDHCGAEIHDAVKLVAVLKNPAYHFKRIGLEAGPLSQWLFSVLAEAVLPVICVETRHMRAVLKAQINKTDRNGAQGIVLVVARRVFWCPQGKLLPATLSARLRSSCLAGASAWRPPRRWTA